MANEKMPGRVEVEHHACDVCGKVERAGEGHGGVCDRFRELEMMVRDTKGRVAALEKENAELRMRVESLESDVRYLKIASVIGS